MTKYTIDEKSNAVLEYLEGKKYYKSIAQDIHVGVSPSEKMGCLLFKTWNGRTCFTLYKLHFAL
ncbi:hypothetical protein [Peribacillus frigoritolerans]|uniref:hypothetical protein n=1 Tax=Peribacillus frigoritolerans TaxID=450367 RepID=UPI002B05AE7F|nr:hypothetical protein [Peribacillus frigoritolerans]MEA3573921.1 hypothetical protein [Peribacillus frigoritolerans]